jgi:glyoxylase-like metal-dependent hydrolase (beta-lactamase superfamily II)
MKLFSIETGNFKLDGGAMFGVVPKVMWQKIYPADENNLCNWAMRALLVDTGERRILIDNGIGDKQDEKFLRNYHLNGDFSLEKSLFTAGYHFEDITDVILTHLHFDHCGGSVKWNDDKTKLELTFPNAWYWSSEQHWNWATSPNNREKASFLKENILPIQEYGKLKLVKNNTEIYPGILLKLFFGHTEGQIIPYTSFNGKTIIYCADLIPAAAHIPIPYVMSYDTRPLITMKEKEVFLKEAADKNQILFFEHDLYHECCTVENTEKGVRVKETFKLSEIKGLSE